jgi:hypothetical protein
MYRIVFTEDAHQSKASPLVKYIRHRTKLSLGPVPFFVVKRYYSPMAHQAKASHRSLSLPPIKGLMES